MGVGLARVSDEVAAGVEQKRIGRRHSVTGHAKGGDLSVMAGLLISFVILVNRRRQREGAVGVKHFEDIELQRPGLIDRIDVISARILGGYDRVDRRTLIDFLLVESGEHSEVLQVGKVNVLRHGGSDGSRRRVDVAGDLEVVRRLGGDRALEVAVLGRVNIFRDRGYGHS